MVSRALGEIHHIVDRSYSIATGIQRISRKERLKYKILTKDIRRGSLLFYVSISVATIPTLFGTPDSAAIWSQVKDAYSLLTMFLEAKRDSRPITINAQNSVVQVVTGDHNLLIPPGSFATAINTQSSFRRLAETIEAGGVEELSVIDETNQGIDLTLENKPLFSGRSGFSDHTIALSADVYEFNKSDGTGALEVVKGDLPPGKYVFSVVGQQDRMPYIQSMLHKEVRVLGFVEYNDRDLRGQVVQRIHVVEINLRNVAS